MNPTKHVAFKRHPLRLRTLVSPGQTLCILTKHSVPCTSYASAILTQAPGHFQDFPQKPYSGFYKISENAPGL